MKNQVNKINTTKPEKCAPDKQKKEKEKEREKQTPGWFHPFLFKGKKEGCPALLTCSYSRSLPTSQSKHREGKRETGPAAIFTITESLFPLRHRTDEKGEVTPLLYDWTSPNLSVLLLLLTSFPFLYSGLLLLQTSVSPFSLALSL